jgi:hypothetical protein
LTHATLLVKNTDEQRQVEKKSEEYGSESMDDLFIESQDIIGRQIASGYARGATFVVIVFTRVDQKKHDVVDKRINAAETQRYVMTEEAFQMRVEKLRMKDQDMAFKGCPRDQ